MFLWQAVSKWHKQIAQSHVVANAQRCSRERDRYHRLSQRQGELKPILSHNWFVKASHRDRVSVTSVSKQNHLISLPYGSLSAAFLQIWGLVQMTQAPTFSVAMWWSEHRISGKEKLFYCTLLRSHTSLGTGEQSSQIAGVRGVPQRLTSH